MGNHWTRGHRMALVPLLMLCAGTVRGEDAVGAPLPPLPEGSTGIAAKYPGDLGIGNDPTVLFADDFEDCTSPADLRKRWSASFGEPSMRITREAADLHTGKQALEFVMPQQATPQSSGLHKIFADGQDVVFLRFYSKFEKGFDYPLETSCHNGVDISANYYTNGATPGIRADGRNKFLVAFENEIGYRGKAPVPGPLNVYLYHPEQRSDYGDHFLPSGTVLPYSPQLGNKGTFGKDFVSRPDLVPELDRWYCFECMVKANTPGQRDGRIALWVDGKLVADFPNQRLRDVGTLKMERIGLGLYMANNSLRVNRKWYDDVVVGTSYIGPMVKER